MTPSWSPTPRAAIPARPEPLSTGSADVTAAVGGRRLLHVFCLLALVLSGAASVVTPESRAAAQAGSYVATTNLNLRTGPSLQSAVLTVIPSGRSVSATGDPQGGFLPVTYSGISGYASQDFLRSGTSGGGTSGGSSGATGGATVQVDALNLRADASSTARVIAVMPYGSRVSLTGESRNGFARLTWNGTSGWAFASYIGGGGSTDGGTDDSGDDEPTTGATGTATTTTDLNLRSGPSTVNAVIAVMRAGASVTLLGQQQGGFAQVRYSGTTGWASQSYLTTGAAPSVPSDDEEPDTDNGAAGNATVAVGSLNLRASASTGAQVVAVMSYGSSVSVLGPRQAGFAQVTFNGTTGWAWEAYLTSGGTAPAPSTQPSTAPSASAAPSTPSAGDNPSGRQLWTTSSVNMRSGPGTSYSVLTVLPAGSSGVSTGGSQNGFWQLNWNGTVGWVSSQFLTTDGSDYVDPPVTSPGGGGSYTQDQIIQIIYAAADRYGQSRSDMLRVARCESVLDPNAVNQAGGSYGLFQFLPGTWATTPYASYDIFDPVANANAAGWMWSVGRRNEWVCQ